MHAWQLEHSIPDRSVTFPAGFRTAGACCGIKPSGRPDLAAVVADAPCDAAVVFTQNQMPGAPILVGRQHLPSGCGTLQAIIVNSGVSNVATGQAGVNDALTMCQAVAEHLHIAPRHVLPSSTGVIGVPLPMQKITPGIAAMLEQLASGAAADASGADAILTTDTRRKLAAVETTIAGKPVRFGAMCKGSGMIAPNMATMLCYVTTDAAVAPALLHKALTHAVDRSFNRISIDSDTSTSDTVALLASGQAGNARIETEGADFAAFQDVLTKICRDLALQVVRDGEGVTKIMRVLVTGAASDADALKVARTLADSPLIKCALHGGDPNWGRLVAATGRSGAALDPTKLGITIAGVTVGQNGQLQPLDPATRARLVDAMKQPDVTLEVSLGAGAGRADFLGCDLSYEYVRINAEYTT